MALLVHEVFLDLPARLANEARSDRVARVVLQVLRANAVLLVDVGCLGLMDLQDQRAKPVIVDQLAQTVPRANWEILVALDRLVCKVCVAFPDGLDRPVNQEALAREVYRELMAKMANRDLKAFRVCLAQWVHPANVVLREKMAKMGIPVQLGNLALAVMLVRMVLLAPKVLPVLLARTENVVLQVRLALVVSKACLVLPEHLETQEKMAKPAFKALLVCPDLVARVVREDSLANAVQ